MALNLLPFPNSIVKRLIGHLISILKWSNYIAAHLPPLLPSPHFQSIDQDFTQNIGHVNTSNNTILIV